MADWKCFRTTLEVLVHPSAERLDLIRCGQYQLVSQKGLHKTGDIAIFIPSASILPMALQTGFKDYLKGPNKDRVGKIRLRGVDSEGILVPDRPEFVEIPLEEDISEKIGVIKYEPPVPVELAGKVSKLSEFDHKITHHDVESWLLNQDQFVLGEMVFITEKLHGSQICIKRFSDGSKVISSKGLIKRGLIIQESDTNSYWMAAKNTNIFPILDELYPGKNIEVFSELLPCQFLKYGFSKPIMRIFDVRIDGEHIPFDNLPNPIRSLWVPIVYRGPYNPTILQGLADQPERVSGKQLHCSEGVVTRPYPDRMSNGKNPFRLMVKTLSSKYKETGEEIN